MLKFYLKEPRKEYSSIDCRANLRSKTIYHSISGLKIPTKHWNKKSQRLNSTVPDLSMLDLNRLLDQADYNVTAFMFNKRISMSFVTHDELLAYIKGQFTIDQPHKEAAFTEYLEDYVSGRAASGKYAKFTIKKEQTLVQKVKQFQESTKNNIDWKDLNAQLLMQFEQWMLAQNYSTNYVATNMKIFKRALRTPEAKKALGSIEWMTDVKIRNSPVDSIFLDVESLNAIEQVDLSHNFKLDRVRDIFLLAAWTGVAYVDISQIPKRIEVVQGKKLIHVRRTKSKVDAVIPLHRTVQKILDKHNGKIPPMVSNQKMNKYIKEVCAMAGIRDQVSMRKYNGAKVTEITKPKYQLVTTHTARRSFATNAVMAGLDIPSIMKITGHKTMKAFLKYVRMDAKTSALNMAGDSFFG